MQDKQKNKKKIFELRKIRTRSKITKSAPRLSIFRSLKHFYIQVIDDKTGTTICSASDKEIKDTKLKPIEKAEKVGEMIAKKAIDKKVEKVVFDRGAFRYHGRVKAAGDAARKAGLKF